MNIYLVLIILMLLYGTKYNKKNNNYLDKSNCSCIKGVFLLFVFYRHIKGYVVNPIENNLYINSLDNFLGQLIVTPFLFYSGFGVMESIKKNKKKYIEKIPAKRCLLTWFNFAIAVLIFLIVDIFMGIEYSKKSIVLSFLAWDTIGNSNWYIFGIIALYLITYLSFSILDKDYKKAIVMNIILSFILILGISYFKENWWYDTLLTYPLGMYYSFYVKDINVVAKIKKHWWKEEKNITLNSDVSMDAIIQILEKELHKREVFYSVVTEDDFFKFKCSHNMGNECEKRDCHCCNCSFDFYDSDITKILKERASYILEE